MKAPADASKRKEYERKYRTEHRAERRAYDRRYYAEHIEEKRQYNYEHYFNNRWELIYKSALRYLRRKFPTLNPYTHKREYNDDIRLTIA
jgi:hypothetical protein